MLTDTVSASSRKRSIDETLVVFDFDGFRFKPSPPIECLGVLEEFILIANSPMNHDKPSYYHKIR